MLLWHNTASKNLGVQALTFAQLDLLNEISQETGLNINVAFCGNKNLNKISTYKKLKIVKYETFEISFKDLILKLFSFDQLFLSKFSEYDFVIDIGEGDSFSDIYGRSRFLQHIVLKSLAIKNSRLILAPQTIGPFKNEFFKLIANALMNRCEKIFVRDTESQKYLKDANLDSSLATDVAFRLEYEKKISNNKIGVNISGLLWFLKQNLNTKITLCCDYRDLMIKVVQDLLSQGYEIELVCHVVSDQKFDDDYRASCEFRDAIGSSLKIVRSSDPVEIKTIISQYNYFIGARMHACIAAVSANVPTAPLAYSKKFDTLFSSVHYEKVIDLRYLNLDKACYEIHKNLASTEKDAFDALNKEVKKKLHIYKRSLGEIINGKN